MPTAATANPTKAMLHLETLISNSATWQTWTGNPGNATLAKAHIYPFNYLPDTDAETHTEASGGPIGAHGTSKSHLSPNRVLSDTIFRNRMRFSGRP